MQEHINFYESKLQFEMDPSDLFEAMNEGAQIVPVDSRRSFAFEAERIPGAVNIPHREMTPETTSHLDRNALYVVYCDGIGCNASTKGALKMSKLGFNVKELIGGLEWWKFDGYATEGNLAKKGLAVKCAC